MALSGPHPALSRRERGYKSSRRDRGVASATVVTGDWIPAFADVDERHHQAPLGGAAAGARDSDSITAIRVHKGVTMLSILGWIVFGLIVGALAKLLMPGHDPGGIIVTILLGIVGALLGGFLGRAIGLYGPGEGASCLS
jgi:uncharacterized membrane protein YeaQ/YmgE (transglycosylase-associated protein family)